jgi:hypothetical protein
VANFWDFPEQMDGFRVPNLRVQFEVIFEVVEFVSAQLKSA